MASKQDTIRQLRDRAADCLASAKIKNAAELYDKLVALEPEAGDWARRGADCYRQLGKTDRQLELLLTAARAYRAEGQLLKGIAMGKLAQRVAPGDARVSGLMQDLSADPSPRERPTFLRPALGRALPARRPSLRASRPASSAEPVAGSSSPSAPSPVVVAPAPDPRASLPPAKSLSEIGLKERILSMGPELVRSLSPESDGVVILDVDDLLIEELDVPLPDLDPGPAGQPIAPVAQPATEGGPRAPSLGPRPTAERALSALGSAELFSELEPEQLRRLVENVELVDLPSGQQLFAQGDAADAMYVVALGEVVAMATEPGTLQQVELARLGSGQFFGEIGLLSNQPRQAGIVAAEETSLLRFPREAITRLIDEDPAFLRSLMRFLRLRLVETLMLTSPLFLPFGPEDRATLQRLFRFLELEQGKVVIREGQKSDGLYVMVTGEAAVVQGEEEVLLGLLGPGDVFGEMSLLKQRPAIASVVVRERAFVLRLPDRYFMEVLMMHPALLEYVATLGATRAEQNAVLLKQADKVLDDHVALF